MHRRRMGIGNIIAGLAFIFLLLFSVSQLYVYNLGLTDDYNRVAEQMVLADIQRANERLSITNADYNPSNGQLVLTVSNTGGENARAVVVWVLPVTGTHSRLTPTGFPVSIPGGQSATLPTIATGLSGSVTFTVRLITERGTALNLKLVSASNAQLAQTLAISPPNPIMDNNVEVGLTVSNNTPDAAYGLVPSIRLNDTNTMLTDATGVCISTSSPIKCERVSAPANLSFLGAGQTVVFKWIYKVNSTVPDKVVTFKASYAALADPAADITATATIRQVGGASEQSVQGLSSILGSLVIEVRSFKFTQDGTCWKSGFQIKGGERTVFRVKVTNIGSTGIILQKESQFGVGSGPSETFYLAAGAVPAAGGRVDALAITPAGITINPGQTVTTFFGAPRATVTPPDPTVNNAEGMPAAGKEWFTFFVLLGTFVGGAPFGQSIPFVALITISTVPSGLCES